MRVRNFYKEPLLCNVWLVFAAALVLMVLSGTDYVWATLLVPLKEHFNYTQLEVQTLGSIRMSSNLFSLLIAFFHDKLGPRATCTMGMLLLLTGYSLTYMATIRLFYLPYYALGFCLTIATCGSFSCYTSALSTCIKNFDIKHRGKVVGVLLCIYGLTGGVFSAIFAYVFKENIVSFLFFMGCFCSAAPIAGIVFLNVVPQKKEEEPVAEATEETRLVSPEAGSNDSNSVNGEESEQVETLKKPVAAVDDGSIPTYRMILTLDFWLLGICVFCSMGSSITLLSNLGGVVQSYGGAQSVTAILMMIYSVASSTGRIMMGVLSDKLSFYMTRVTFLNCCFLSIGACLFTCIFAIVPMFYPLMFIFGISYGGMMCMTPSIISDRWGTKYFSTNLAGVFLFQLLGSYLLGTLMASSIYQSHIVGSGKKCRGRACFQLTFVICTALCLVSFITALVLMHRTKPIYAKINKAKKENA